MKLQRIVVATDFSETSQVALRQGTALAVATGARLLILHVESPEVVFGGEELDLLAQPVENAVAKHLLEQTLPSDPRVSYEHHLVTGSAAEEIVRFAKQHQADLVIIGTHGRAGAWRLLVGSVAASVVRHASCPVLTVKSGRFRQLAEEE